MSLPLVDEVAPGVRRPRDRRGTAERRRHHRDPAGWPHARHLTSFGHRAPGVRRPRGHLAIGQAVAVESRHQAARASETPAPSRRRALEWRVCSRPPRCSPRAGGAERLRTCPSHARRRSATARSVPRRGRRQRDVSCVVDDLAELHRKHVERAREFASGQHDRRGCAERGSICWRGLRTPSRSANSSADTMATLGRGLWSGAYMTNASSRDPKIVRRSSSTACGGDEAATVMRPVYTLPRWATRWPPGSEVTGAGSVTQ